MIRNYITIAFRNFNKNRSYTFLNIFGLALGLMVCFTQFAIFQHEFSFDDFHEKKDRIYRVVEHYDNEKGLELGGVLPNPMGRALASHKKLIEDVIPMFGPVSGKVRISKGSTIDVYSQSRILFTNSSFLRHLDFPIISGATPELLDQPGKAFISREIANKFFGHENVVGQVFELDESLKVEIVGVLEDIPTNTNVPFEILVSDKSVPKLYDTYADNWGAYWVGSAYVLLRDGDEVKTIRSEINSIFQNYATTTDKSFKHYELQPLENVHTDDRYGRSVNYVPPSSALLGSLVTVLVILFISILNFVNLSTSQAIGRSKEIGIRKTLGGQKQQLIIQFLVETFFIVLFSLLLGLTFGQILIDLLNQAVSGMSFHLSYSWYTVLFGLGLLILVTLLAGIYPAYVISEYSPLQSLHNKLTLKTGAGSLSLRKVLITLQFVFATFLIFSMVISYSQLEFLENKKLGFSSDDIMLLNFSDKVADQMDVVRQEFSSASFAKDITLTYSAPQSTRTRNTTFRLGDQPLDMRHDSKLYFVDDGYLDFYQIPLIYGQNLENKYNGDSLTKIIVNQEFARVLQYDPVDLLGKTVFYDDQFRGQVIGIVEDFHNSKLSHKIRPAILSYVPRYMNQLNIKVHDGSKSAYLKEMESIFRDVDEYGIFNPEMLTDNIAKMYTYERIIGNCMKIFALIALLIGAMGLYGLVSFMIQRNLKNISIRKIFGASQGRLLLLISKDYLVLICIAYAIGVPLAHYLMGSWLQNSYYRVEIAFIHFLITFLVVLILVLVTVGYKTYRAAVLNPVDTLRHE